MPVALSGCATLQENRTACRATAAGIGAVAGGLTAGFGVGSIDLSSSKETGAIAAGAAGGAAVGAVLGLVAAHWACPEPQPAPPPPVAEPQPPPAAGTKIVTLDAPHFDFDRAELRPSGRATVDEAVAYLREHPDVRVAAEGHTDAIGSEAYNLRLSERRATTVRDYMIEQGIAPDRIVARGYGKARPIADNDTPEGRAQNRRVDIVVE